MPLTQPSIEKELLTRFWGGFDPVLGAVPWKSLTPLTGHADGGEQRSRYAILTAGSGSRYPYALWCLVPVWKSGSGRLRPRRGDDSLLPQAASIPVGRLP